MMKKSSGGVLYLWLAILILILAALSCNLPRGDSKNLNLDSTAADGSISGMYSGESGDYKVNFRVTKDGLATFHVEGAPDSETLTVKLGDEQTASINWKGITFDGLGGLSGEEQSALEDLMGSDLAYGLEMIPLDIGCRGEDGIDPKQVAALLVPLQMHFKYLVTERESESERLIALSQCDYGDDGGGEQASVIMLSHAAPVPVVFGYFPFDADGAVEPPMSSGEGGVKTACLSAPPSLTPDGRIRFSPLSGNPETITGLRTNEKGPCNAMCRGACGADCEPNNCKMSKELRCEKDEAGINTGMVVQYLIYDCGMHQGCIEHDDCYDRCNAAYGCGSWLATACRHEWSPAAEFAAKSITWWCDQRAASDYGAVDPALWAQGLGPQPMRETFEYVDEEFESQWNPERCPEEEVDSPPLDENGASIPVGTYMGESNFSSTLENDVDDSFAEPICKENTVTVVVESDGTAYGELRSICYANQREGDMSHHSEVIGIIGGTLPDTQGQLTVSYTWRSYIDSPQWETPSMDNLVNFEFLYHVSVSNGIMKFTPAGDVEDYYAFELVKQ